MNPTPTARPEPAGAPPRAAWTGLDLALMAMLAALMLLAFFPVFGNGFVDWDDDQNFVDNPDFRGLGWAEVRWAFTTRLLGVYQPVSWLLLSLQHERFGLDPWGYHIVSLAMQAVNAAVAYALVRTLLARSAPGLWEAEGGPKRVRLAVAACVALFMAHPLRVEAVAWASAQPYLPCAFFYMLAVLAYLKAHPGGDARTRPGWLAACLACTLAALLSKAVAVSLPVVFLILDVYPLRRVDLNPARWDRRALWAGLEKLPFLALSGWFMVEAVRAKAVSETLIPLAYDGMLPRVGQACFGIWFYIGKTFWPAGIQAFYAIPPERDWYLAPRVLACGVLTIAVTAAAIANRRRRPWLLAAWAAYLAILGPNLGIARIGVQIAADRYSYVPGLALVALLAGGLASVRWSSAWRAPLGGTFALGLIALVLLSWDQCLTWKTSESLFRHALVNGGERSFVVWHNLGKALIDRNEVDEGLFCYRQALRIHPKLEGTHRNIGMIMTMNGRVDEAVAHYERAVALKPTDPKTHNNLGILLSSRREYGRAVHHFRTAIRLRPDFRAARRNLASALALRGQLDQAIAAYEEVLRLWPDQPRDLEALALLRERLASTRNPSRPTG